MNIGFIGLGKLGKPCAEVMAQHYPVYGYDIRTVRAEGVTLCEDIREIPDHASLIFIAVQTPHHKEYGGESPTSTLEARNFDYTDLKTCLSSIASYLTPQHTIVIISTVLPGTIRKELAPLLPAGTLVYNPYLIAMGTVKEDMTNPEMIIIGTKRGNDPAVSLLKELYNKISAHPCRYETGTWEEAEAIKIFYNTFISAKIGIVNMIQDVAEKNGHINVDIVTGALARSNKRITSAAYMKAGMGDGGPCHPRDNIALSWLAGSLDLGYDLFKSIIESREKQAFNMAQKLVSYHQPVVILGSSYKPEVTLTDGSYALLVAHYVQLAGTEIFLDTTPDQRSFTYLLGHDKDYDDQLFNPGSVVVDPWRKFSSGRNDLMIIHYGNTRQE